MSEARKTILLAALGLLGATAAWKGGEGVSRHSTVADFLQAQIEFIDAQVSRHPNQPLLLEVDAGCWHFVGDDEVETVARCAPRTFAGPRETVLREVERYDKCIGSAGFDCGPEKVLVEDAKGYREKVVLARDWNETRNSASTAALFVGVVLVLVSLLATPVAARRAWRDSRRQRGTMIRANDVLEPLQRAQELRDTNMIDASEVRSRVGAVIGELDHKVFEGDLDAFLEALIPLRASGVLTSEDVQAIKAAVAGGEE